MGFFESVWEAAIFLRTYNGCKLVKKYWLILTKAVQFKPTFSKTDMCTSARKDNFAGLNRVSCNSIVSILDVFLWKMQNSFKVMDAFADNKKKKFIEASLRP